MSFRIALWVAWRPEGYAAAYSGVGVRISPKRLEIERAVRYLHLRGDPEAA
jgi:hypothetical protein